MASRWGSDPVSIGADSGVWRRALRSPRVGQDFVRRKVVDDDHIVALELGARPDEVFATHSRERRPHLAFERSRGAWVTSMERAISCPRGALG